MSDKLIVKLPEDLASWLTEAARKAGVSRERFVRMELERARKVSKHPFMRLVGAIEGPRIFLRAKVFHQEGRRSEGANRS